MLCPFIEFQQLCPALGALCSSEWAFPMGCKLLSKTLKMFRAMHSGSEHLLWVPSAIVNIPWMNASQRHKHYTCIAGHCGTPRHWSQRTKTSAVHRASHHQNQWLPYKFKLILISCSTHTSVFICFVCLHRVWILSWNYHILLWWYDYHIHSLHQWHARMIIIIIIDAMHCYGDMVTAAMEGMPILWLQMK